MAPALASDPVSQADTPMTDTNHDTVPSVPVDSADAQVTVCVLVPFCLPVRNGCLVTAEALYLLALSLC
jgi:hypothetical protein